MTPFATEVDVKGASAKVDHSGQATNDDFEQISALTSGKLTPGDASAFPRGEAGKVPECGPSSNYLPKPGAQDLVGYKVEVGRGSEVPWMPLWGVETVPGLRMWRMNHVILDRSYAPQILDIINEVIETSTALWDYKPRTLPMMSAWFDAKEAGRPDPHPRK
jgi:hypothetical protein